MLNPSYNTIKLFDLPLSERPRERLVRYGSSALSDTELLALVLRSGGKGISARTLAEELLKKFKNYRGLLLADTAELISFRNIGLAKATSLKAACEIGLRLTTDVISLGDTVTTPADIYKLMRSTLYAKSKEHLYVVSLDSRLRVISTDLVSVGTVNEALAHPREIFSSPVKKGAVSIIVVHNHPSNDPSPSSADIELTNRVAESGAILGIKLQDHIIACDDTFNSLKELGLISLKEN